MHVTDAIKLQKDEAILLMEVTDPGIHRRETAKLRWLHLLVLIPAAAIAFSKSAYATLETIYLVLEGAYFLHIYVNVKAELFKFSIFLSASVFFALLLNFLINQLVCPLILPRQHKLILTNRRVVGLDNKDVILFEIPLDQISNASVKNYNDCDKSLILWARPLSRNASPYWFPFLNRPHKIKQLIERAIKYNQRKISSQ